MKLRDVDVERTKAPSIAVRDGLTLLVTVGTGENTDLDNAPEPAVVLREFLVGSGAEVLRSSKRTGEALAFFPSDHPWVSGLARRAAESRVVSEIVKGTSLCVRRVAVQKR